MSRSRIRLGGRLQAVDEVRRALRVAGRGEDRAVVCLEHVEQVGDVGGMVLARFKREIKIGTEERGAEFGLCGIPHKPSYAERRIMPHDGAEPLDSRVRCSA
jgi:hypothetical protein